MHIGLIGGIGPAATEYYYRGLVRAYSKMGKTLDLTIVHADTRVLLDNLSKGDAARQAQIFLGFVQRLKAAGADIAAVTSLAGHFCIKELEAISPLPLISAIPALNTQFDQQGFQTVGLLGTRTVLESRLYGGITSANLIVPAGDDLEKTHTNYIEIATAGRATSEHRSFFHQMGRKLCHEQGADAVALAGTDLFMVFDRGDADFQIVDCAQVHVDALVDAAA
ncbi:MAG: aspartate/glutamate racemase family protein [Alphaproteobacteria bacterium]|nr:aspartate/glutamate racemase family protein [Alphaproteobacteria bacterium]